MSDGFSHIDQERTRSGGKTGIPAPGWSGQPRPCRLVGEKSASRAADHPTNPRVLAIVEFAIPPWPAGSELITGKFQGTRPMKLLLRPERFWTEIDKIEGSAIPYVWRRTLVFGFIALLVTLVEKHPAFPFKVAIPIAPYEVLGVAM